MISCKIIICWVSALFLAWGSTWYTLGHNSLITVVGYFSASSLPLFLGIKVWIHDASLPVEKKTSHTGSSTFQRLQDKNICTFFWVCHSCEVLLQYNENYFCPDFSSCMIPVSCQGKCLRFQSVVKALCLLIIIHKNMFSQ